MITWSRNVLSVVMIPASLLALSACVMDPNEAPERVDADACPLSAYLTGSDGWGHGPGESGEVWGPGGGGWGNRSGSCDEVDARFAPVSGPGPGPGDGHGQGHGHGHGHGSGHGHGHGDGHGHGHADGPGSGGEGRPG